MGYEPATKAQQVFGGHGYIVENGMEQFVRDARIAMIYEGTNGVQAMDLVGRKLPKDGGRAVRAFFALVSAEVAEAKNVPALAEFAGRLEKANGELQQASLWLMQNRSEERRVGKRVSERVELGGGRSIKKKKNKNKRTQNQ